MYIFSIKFVCLFVCFDTEVNELLVVNAVDFSKDSPKCQTHSK